MNKRILLAGALSLTMTACSHGSNGNGNASATAGKQQTIQHEEQYGFVLKGCDTKKHDFSSSSAEDVKKQLCDALQDDVLNHSCAEPLRYEYFTKKCSGIAWTPKYARAESPKPTPSQPSPSSPVDSATLDKVRDSLKFVLVDSYKVAAGLVGQEEARVTLFAEDMTSCGLSYVGPKCFGYDTFAGDYDGSLNEVDGKFIFFSELKMNGLDFDVAFKFTVDQMQPVVVVSHLEVLKILRARGGQSVAQFLNDPTNFSPLVTLTVSNDFQKSAWSHVQTPRDIRQLYHLTQGLLEINAREGKPGNQTKRLLVASIEDNTSMIVRSPDTQYQERTLSLITNDLKVPASLLVKICTGLLNSKSENIKQIAATIVLDAQPERSDLKPIVQRALNNERWDIRKKAVLALGKTQMTTEDENLILAKIGDQDADVEKAAIAVSAKITVDAKHFATVKQLESSDNWVVREESAKLLGRMNSPASNKELIARMDDSDQDVSRQSVSQLSQKSLDGQYIPALEKTFGSENWVVRNEAAKLLGKISENEATILLISKMDDSVDDVRKTIVVQLGKRSLSESHVSNLVKQYKSENWTVRKDVSILLGKISGLVATEALIKQMVDQDQDVRNAIVNLLAARPLVDASVASLKANFASDDWTVRRDVAKLLGKIRTPSSLNALLDQLTRETDNDVKKQITASISVVKN